MLWAQGIGRRAVVGAAAAMAARPALAGLPIPAGHELAFRLIRHGSEIGRHTLIFDQAGGTLTVHVAVDALVTLLSIPIVRYKHRVTEVWQDGMLASVTGDTNKNGEQEWVRAQRGPEGIVVLGSKTERYVAPEPAGCTSYWNRATLSRPMISMEDGVLLRPKVVEHPAETIPLASGQSIMADHYNLSGAFRVDLWYDETNTWASLGLPATDGSYVRYERL
jgi:Family of unknown function (DUF6134)